MINFKKEAWFNKNPKFEKVRKSQQNAWGYAWKHENKCKRKGIKVLPALGEENLAKEWTKTTKIWGWALTESYGERKVIELFEKVFDSTENQFLKNFSYDFRFIEVLGSIDRNKQRLT